MSLNTLGQPSKAVHKSGKEDRVEWVETSDSGDLWQKDNSKNEKKVYKILVSPTVMYCIDK